MNPDLAFTGLQFRIPASLFSIGFLPFLEQNRPPLRSTRLYGNPTTVAACELCELARTTNWYAEFTQPFRFVIVDCDSCDVPMVVLGVHRAAPLPDERVVMQEALARIADTKYPRGWYYDDHMRQIPDHYHLHARPYPSWWPRQWREAN